MWALSEVREKVYNFQKLPLDKSHFITEVTSTATKGTKKGNTNKICLACPPEENKNIHPLGDFYLSKNPMHKDGKLPWCKNCIKQESLNKLGEIDEEKFKSVLRQIDRPYYKDVLQSAVKQYKKEHSYIEDNDIKYHGEDIIGLYFKNLNTLRQVANKSYGDSEKEGFVRKQGVQAASVNIGNTIKQTVKDKHYSNIDDFEVTEEIKSLFGDGYDTLEYKKMFDKYEKLKINYTLQTNIHQEALATYVRFKVKEEDATARGNVDEAKKWYDAAQNAAEKAKLTPKQLTKADLDSGVNSVSELTKAVEQAVDVIKIMPQFKYRPNDAPDFNIWCYVDYERKLNDQPPISYEDVYSFYDKRREEYISQNGDPYGIFNNEPTLKNRETVKTFIKLPDDYEELAGDAND